MQKMSFIIAIKLTAIWCYFAIEGINDEDFRGNLWNNLKNPAPTLPNAKNSKLGQNYINKEQIEVRTQIYDQRNAKRIKIENCQDEEEEEHIIAKDLNQFKKKPFVDSNNDNGRNAKIKLFKNKKNQSSNDRLNNSSNEQQLADQTSNYSSDDGSDLSQTTKLKLQILNRRGLIPKQILEEDEHTKLKLIRKFDHINKERRKKLKFDKKTNTKIEYKIAQRLGTSRRKIYLWKSELMISKKYSYQQKQEKIEQFEKVKEEFSKKFKLAMTREITHKIAKKIGVDERTIRRWKKEFGINKRILKSDAEKMEIVKEFNRIKQANPLLSDRKIAKQLATERFTINSWRKKFSGIKQK